MSIVVKNIDGVEIEIKGCDYCSYKKNKCCSLLKRKEVVENNYCGFYLEVIK